ncbi:MAG: tetratricopeptide repeat protein [Victivallales bacterium]|nr:tetratricopeptide repeat protein [Victivallales bacterium]
MTKDRRKRILILILLFLVLLGVGVPVSYYAVKTREHVKTMQSALDAYENKDYDKAVELFKKVLQKDADNEMAVSKLAEIYCALGNWAVSSAYWSQACRLNNLNKDYERNYVNMAMRARAFKRVTNLYTDTMHKDLDLDKQLVLDYCLLLSQEIDDGIELWNKIIKENPEALDKPYGRLIKITHFAAQQTFENAFKELGDLASSEDVIIAQEALMAQANLNKMTRQYASEEEDLKKLADINFFIGAPMLGEFYSNHSKFVEAIDVFEKYTQKYNNSNVAIILGELLLFTNQYEKLEKLAKTWKQLSGKNNIMATYYLESVNALAKKDYNALAAAYKPLQSQDHVNTALAAFISILVDVHNNDTNSLVRDLLHFQSFPPFLDLRAKVHSLIVVYLQDRMKAGESPRELFVLADALLKANLAEDSNSLPNLVSMIGKLQNNSLSEKELTSNMQLLPNNPTCLEVAIVFNYTRNNMAEAAKYLDQLEKIENNEIPLNIKKLAIDIFILQGNIDEAAERFRQVLEADRTVDSYSRYFLFCFGNNRKDDLKKLVEKIEDDKELEPVKLFCNAGLELLDGSTDKALDMLERIDTVDNNLLFFSGMQFAANKRTDKAIEKLDKITQQFDKYPRVLIILSSLHMDKNDNAKAKSYAEKALQIAPNAVEAQKLLALCFHAEGDWMKTLDYSEVSLWENSKDEEWRKIWIGAMEKNIAYEFDAKHYASSLHLCNMLLKHDKDNEVAAGYLAKIEAIEQQDKPEAE